MLHEEQNLKNSGFHCRINENPLFLYYLLREQICDIDIQFSINAHRDAVVERI